MAELRAAARGYHLGSCASGLDIRLPSFIRLHSTWRPNEQVHPDPELQVNEDLKVREHRRDGIPVSHDSITIYV